MVDLDAAFSALGDPTRRAILARLALGEATVMELAQPFAMSQPAISRHIKVLESAGLISRRVEGTRRPCRLSPVAIAEIDQWLGMMRKALAANYDRLDALLATMEKGEGKE
ncbi:transcriptional regulator [Mesorhizobium sp. L-8-10]|uniref:ArsR/SmtB family transcription factor n=1 Tax=unclassified Mesorhizobium TaxID=325217 RepID=UPI001927A7D7|nr:MULTISPECIES: metalloregulator ArsR/SmtB family transcription factor [unclassified Mesorhizobium]BCH22014.1 transcriptional regulator [Mesorhizobium sp. L-8-3]BCH29708.1 transcriptional regulator [Mesorhizobium sp. L-8-10]